MRNTTTAIRKISERIETDLFQRKIPLEKRNVEGLADLAATVLHVRNVNTADWISVLPRTTGLRKSREVYIGRFLGNFRITPEKVMGPIASEAISRIGANGSTVILALDQSKISDGFECLMMSVRFAGRALPVLWKVVQTSGNVGFDVQRELLDRVREFLPENVPIMLAADRFYGTSALVEYCNAAGWGYRIRLKGGLRFLHGGGEIGPAEALALGMESMENAAFAGSGVVTNIGILHEAGHPEPWYIAMNAKPTEYRTLDYGMRWGIECMFSDFKSRGFGITGTRLKSTDKIERLILILSIALYYCVSTGMRPDPETRKHTKKNAEDRPYPSSKEGCASSWKPS